ncbi:MAG: S8 family peptidase [Butyribacter sp.]|nr:S8 family serine peptidase [bacterium]MDY3854850.1 S8 family peptidase [Butyribacter sp.]
MEQGNEKLEEALRAALQLSKEEADKESPLYYGYDEEEKLWQVIVKYNGDIQKIEKMFADTRVTELFNQYAIITTREEYIQTIASLPEIAFMEKPKRLYFNLEAERSISCINAVQGSTTALNLTGEGVLVGIVDSGIDYTHPTFRNADGSSRIAYLWDQSATNEQAQARTPAGYGFGAQYTMEDINQALQGNADSVTGNAFPTTERGSGHGTAVAGIAAGNGNGSAGNRYRGIAVNSELIVVKLGRKDEDFAGTTEVMEGMDYIMRKAIALQKPVVINLSFGNNAGAHDGQSLFENYISELSSIWKNVIVAASGNEGDARHHARLLLRQQEETVFFAIGPREKNISLQIWKDYVDDFSVFLEAPDGQKIFIASNPGTAMTYQAGADKVFVYYGIPTPYTVSQEIYIEWLPVEEDSFVKEGIWSIHFLPEKIVNGTVNLWLPTVEQVGLSTGFLSPEPDTTLTIPSTAFHIITVGAYQSDNDSLAPFSGRGDTSDLRQMPTLVAPGVNVITAVPGGRYGARTGTSIAAPFVTGSVALMMEWGIVRGNDSYLYGEKVKAYLMKGARPLPGEPVPSVRQGYGALCLKNSLPV